MPTYQYACTECDHGMEVVQSFSDESLTVCPQCQGRLRKVYSAVGIVFKGSGFYRTDSGTSSDSSVLAGSNGSGTNGNGSGKGEAAAASSDSGASSTSSSSASTASSSSSSSGGSASTSSAPAAATS
ncbi:putative FmdB family regulatory protein [Nocardiopsis mwathae]|uniref:Putative FmdB family regulatory protein n=1 Tax=Nocardiopsis mwathae TaxID=1472723 RepID=A0A7W9YJX0_9ACTN|nr:putative FmdB family regulatory protein [Nocardiopsis mwathae]